MKSSFKYPKVFADLSELYKSYFLLHSHLPKSFQLTTGQTILLEMTHALKSVVLINGIDNKTISYHLAIQKLQSVLTSMTIIRAMLNVGWQLKAVSNGNIIKLYQHIEGIEKQISAWQHWFKTQC